MISAIAPLFIAAISLVLRLINLGVPKGYVFDEVYYVDGAKDFLKYGVEVTGNKPEFIVHPPVGKWLIAFGMKIFGNNEFGWRFATAIFGTLLILVFARLVHVLFYSPLLTALGSSLMAMDGLLLVHSRTALLDLFLTFFILCAIYFWSQNQHWGALVFLGLAGGVKWSAIYFLVCIGLVSLYKVFSSNSGKELIRPTLIKIFQYGFLPILIYISTWLGWFLSDRGWGRNWSNNPFKSLWHYHAEILSFHTGLVEKHSYQSNPWSWLVMGRPTSFFYDAPTGCGVKDCAQEVLALGTPLLWWTGTIALTVTLGLWLRAIVARKSDLTLNIIALGIIAGYLPWFFIQQRTMFTFYAIVFEPYLILAMLYCAKALFHSTMKPAFSQGIVFSLTLLIFLNFIYFLPLFTGEVISYQSWHRYMWFPSWI